MPDLPTLYDHQEDMVARLRASLASHRRSILCANPGVGKTRMAKWLMGAAMNKPKKPGRSGEMLFAVHRRGLVDNASQSFSESPSLPHGVIMSGVDTAWHYRVQVASIDTLLSWHVDDTKYTMDRTFDLVIFDECHSHLSKLRKWLGPHDKKREQLGLDPSFVVGLSATPDADDLADMFGEIVCGPSTEWLIENGYLSTYDYYRATEGRLGLLVRRGSSYTEESQDKAFGGLAGDLVADWKRFAEGVPTVGFFPRLSHAREAQKRLCDAGVRAKYVDGSTPDDKRNYLFRALDLGDIDYLCNVGVVERGTNIPAIGCVQLCVAVGSVTRYRQMIGRGSRTAEGKEKCIVLDHGGNIARHGFFEDDPEWVLDRRTRDPGGQPQRPTIHCPKCDRIYRGGACTACGFEPTPKQRRSQGLEFDGRELVRVERPKTTRILEPVTSNELMISALCRGGKAGLTFKQTCVMARKMAEERGMKRFTVPRMVEVGGRIYSMPPFGHTDGSRKVRHLFDWAQ